MDQRTKWKWFFWVFSNSEINITNRMKKVDEKNGVTCLVSMFPSQVMALRLSKKVHFLQFWADLSKKSKSIKATYLTFRKHLFKFDLRKKNFHACCFNFTEHNFKNKLKNGIFLVESQNSSQKLISSPSSHFQATAHRKISYLEKLRACNGTFSQIFLNNFQPEIYISLTKCRVYDNFA